MVLCVAPTGEVLKRTKRFAETSEAVIGEGKSLRQFKGKVNIGDAMASAEEARRECEYVFWRELDQRVVVRIASVDDRTGLVGGLAERLCLAGSNT